MSAASRASCASTERSPATATRPTRAPSRSSRWNIAPRTSSPWAAWSGISSARSLIRSTRGPSRCRPAPLREEPSPGRSAVWAVSPACSVKSARPMRKHRSPGRRTWPSSSRSARRSAATACPPMWAVSSATSMSRQPRFPVAPTAARSTTTIITTTSTSMPRKAPNGRTARAASWVRPLRWANPTSSRRVPTRA